MGCLFLDKVLEKNVSKGKMTEDEKNDVLKRVSVSTEMSGVKDCDIVIEV